MRKINKLPKRVENKTAAFSVEPRGMNVRKKLDKYKQKPPQDLRFFREELLSRGMLEKQAGASMGLKPDEISRVFAGARRLQPEEIVIAAQLIDMSVDDFHRHMGGPITKDPVGDVEVVGVVDSSFAVEATGKGAQTVPRPDKMRSLNAVKFRAPGSMFDRAIGYYRYTYNRTPESAYGRLCVCHLAKGRGVLVRVVQPKAPSRGVFDLYSVPGVLTESAVELEVAFPVVLIRWP